MAGRGQKTIQHASCNAVAEAETKHDQVPEVYNRLQNKCTPPNDTREDVINYLIDEIGHPSTFKSQVLTYHRQALPPFILLYREDYLTQLHQRYP